MMAWRMRAREAYKSALGLRARELTRRDDDLVVLTVVVRVAEAHTQHGCATARVVQHILHQATQVALW